MNKQALNRLWGRCLGRMYGSALGGFFLVVVFSACSDGKKESHHEASPPTASASSVVSCQKDARAEVYAASMQKTTQGGHFTVVLVSSDPAPPRKGNQTWIFKILDQDHHPVSQAAVTLKPLMPDHNHGSGVVNATFQEDAYHASPINLFMPGLWQITLSIQAGGHDKPVTDSVVFSFCLES